MKKNCLLAIAMILSTFASAQWGTAYGFKSGLTLGTQRWNTQEREVQPGAHGVVFLESVDQESGTGLFGQFGYHMKGSRIVFRSSVFVDQSGNERELPRRSFRQPFNNLSLVFGGKKSWNLTDYTQYFIGIGIRGDFTVDYDLYFGREYLEEYVRPFNYGLTVMGGFEFSVGDSGNFLVEFSFHPDISKQIDLPVTIPYYDIRTNQLRTLNSQQVTNATYEISVGYKLIRWN